MKTNLILIGGGIVVNEVIWIIEQINKKQYEFNFLGIVDDDPNKQGILGNDVWLIENREKLKQEHGEISLICTIGNPIIKKKVCQKLEPYFSFTNLINPSTKIHPKVKIGKGVIIQSGVTISNNVELKDHVYLNFDVFIAHDVKIGKYCSLSPKTNIMGNINIGEANFFGATVTVIPQINIGDNNIIGAGTVITKNFDSNNTIVGVPAKAIKKNNG